MRPYSTMCRGMAGGVCWGDVCLSSFGCLVVLLSTANDDDRDGYIPPPFLFLQNNGKIYYPDCVLAIGDSAGCFLNSSLVHRNIPSTP